MTSPRRVRVLVVDDSAFARKVLREALAKSPAIEVVGIARDGLEALESIAELKPDVVTLDLVMPNLDGIGVLHELAALDAKVRVVVVSISDGDSELVVQALQLGAIELVKKPTALATDRLYELSGDLTRAVLNAAAAQVRRSPAPTESPVAIPLVRSSAVEIVVVGTSTGGPQALTRLLAKMPPRFPVPMVIGLHIPADYTESLAARLDSESPLDVVEARDGLELRPGLVVVAKGGIHTKIERKGKQLVVRLTSESNGTFYFPSIDLLFASAAKACGANVLGVVLTGMGDDGLLGAKAIVGAGGRVLTEEESSCVVYGMPRVVKQAGYAAAEAAIDDMAAAIVRSALI